ncbi:uncharacterized protein LOC112906335 [Agrilus planipennis]|uniref:Uncharacterized protein LOC112906335 n=1 Tax=Agrilus planipennis TaxID=224129 RepID=A0A7F5RJB0_AGRPL|nr:uncharacterized protein LOC112906335 [Agrilus planipennis]
MKVHIWQVRLQLQLSAGMTVLELVTNNAVTGMDIKVKRKSDIVEQVDLLVAEYKGAGHAIRRMRSDNAAEFHGQEMTNVMRKYSIKQEFSTPRVPEQNGRAERQNRTIVEMARTLLIAAHLPTRLWAEACRTAAYIRNLIPLRRLHGKTPSELFYGRKPDVSHLRVYGSTCYVHIEKDKRKKFDKKIIEPDTSSVVTLEMNLRKEKQAETVDGSQTEEETLISEEGEHSTSSSVPDNDEDFLPKGPSCQLSEFYVRLPEKKRLFMAKLTCHLKSVKLFLIIESEIEDGLDLLQKYDFDMNLRVRVLRLNDEEFCFIKDRQEAVTRKYSLKKDKKKRAKKKKIWICNSNSLYLQK